MRLRSVSTALLLLAAPVSLGAQQTHLTTPQEAIGHEVGADYFLPNYTQLTEWWQKLAAESPRMVLDTIGRSAEGRPQLMAIISSPANIAHLDQYRRTSATLARGRVDSATARRLAQTGKAIVWIDGGLHATEVLGANQLMELVWEMVSENDAETLRFLNDDILLAVQVNPDGQQLVADWYMRNPDSLQRSMGGLPRLYEKYAGHDDNRDWYRAALPETQNGERIQYLTWYPQIIYNHHQSGPAGSVMFMPPFRDPFNYVFDPLIPTSLDWVAMAMQRRFAAEGKGGFVSKNASDYSTWWNGGLRTAGYFHNMIGILTEAIGSPTPETIPIVLSMQLPDGSNPMPVHWGPWHFRQSIDYSMTADRAILDLASKNRESLLFDFWVMGHREIADGEKDSWTVTPKMIAAADTAGNKAMGAAAAGGGGRGAGGGGGGRGFGRGGNAQVQQAYESVLRDPARRDPRAYVIPSDQPQFAQALDFLQSLAWAGIEINKATTDFTLAGKHYPKGSFVVLAAQAFRPHVLDMFEPQWYPLDLEYPGGPPKRPYDVAGYTLAYQMGISFDRILDSFPTPPMVQEPLGKVTADPAAFDASARGWLLSPASNDAFLAVNRLGKAGQAVQRLGNGDFLVPAGATSARILGELARTRGLATRNATGNERGTAVKPLRIGLWDQYGGSMPAGWARWILEHYESPFTRVFAPRLNAGDLRKDFDVLVFLGGIPGNGGGRGGRGFGGGGRGFGGGRGGNANIPAEYQDEIGSMSVDTTIPQIRQFLEQGGRVIAIGGSATNLAQDLDLPVENQVQGLSNAKYYIPGSVLQVAVDTTQPAAAGAPDNVDVFFDNSPVWHLGDNAASLGIRKIAWFAAPDPLRSGWAIGQEYLKDGVEMFSAPVGRGMAYFYAPDVTFRAQPEGTFKFLFNVMYGTGGTGN
jgi:Zinc carboxypeptidase